MGVPRITKEDLKQRLEAPEEHSRPVVIDVRLKYPYEHSTVRLPNAIRLSPAQPNLASLPRDREIVAYDSDPDELVSARIVADLLRQGYRAAALKGGIPDWIAAKFPLETKGAPQMAPPTPGSLKG
jgi:rhodanese-related sulfurtransferase